MRHEILRPNEPLENCTYPEDSTFPSQHFAAFEADRIIGVASMYRQDAPRDRYEAGYPQCAWRLRGMATATKVRGRGIGERLLQDALAFVQANGGDAVWCNARTTAQGFYERANFHQIGAAFDLAGIGPHVFLEWRPE